MPKPSPLRMIKRCLLFRPWDGAKSIPSMTRGLYVLYRKVEPPARGYKKELDVFYIGIAGVRKDTTRGIGERLKHHAKSKSKKGRWSHYSFFEVHDNITSAEIMELEGLLLHIFRHDPRVELQNDQVGSSKLKRLSTKAVWKS